MSGKKKNIKKFELTGIVNLKVFILAFLITFSFCFFVGIFWIHPLGKTAFNDQNWYYINRGYPAAWAGVSREPLSVNFPIIKAPFLIREYNGSGFAKVIDVSIFLPLFLTVFIIAYNVSFIFIKATEKNKKVRRYVIFCDILFAVTSIFIYFFLFPTL